MRLWGANSFTPALVLLAQRNHGDRPSKKSVQSCLKKGTFFGEGSVNEAVGTKELNKLGFTTQGWPFMTVVSHVGSRSARVPLDHWILTSDSNDYLSCWAVIQITESTHIRHSRLSWVLDGFFQHMHAWFWHSKKLWKLQLLFLLRMIFANLSSHLHF